MLQRGYLRGQLLHPTRFWYFKNENWLVVLKKKCKNCAFKLLQKGNFLSFLKDRCDSISKPRTGHFRAHRVFWIVVQLQSLCPEGGKIQYDSYSLPLKYLRQRASMYTLEYLQHLLFLWIAGRYWNGFELTQGHVYHSRRF